MSIIEVIGKIKVECEMKQTVIYVILAFSVLINIAWGVLSYCSGNSVIKERLLLEVIQELSSHERDKGEIKSIQVKYTLPFQKNRLDIYGFKEGWEVQIIYHNEPDRIQYYFYSEDSGETLDSIALDRD